MPLSAEREIFQIAEIAPQQPPNLTEPNLYGNDLSFNGHETQHSMHAIHPYVAAMNPPLARQLIETYVPENENILDPFCGGGGVLLEASLAKRINAGGDVNPLGVLMAKAKTTYVDPFQIRKAFSEVIHLAEQLNGTTDILIDPQTKFWFKENTIPYIDSLAKAIKEVTTSDATMHNLFKVIFSATIRDVMLTYRGEVRLRKLTGGDLEKFNPDVYRTFAKRYKTAFDRVVTLPKGWCSDIAVRDIRDMEFSPESFHAIVCSPPYADDKNGVGYFQFSRNMLTWLGYTPEEINSQKRLFLGASREVRPLPSSESLSTSLANVEGRSQTHFKEGVAFYYDYNLALAEMARVTRKWIIMVVGNRVLSRTQFDNAQITVDFFQQMGIPLKHHYTRELRKKRIANLGGDGGGIAKEHILVFQKN